MNQSNYVWQAIGVIAVVGIASIAAASMHQHINSQDAAAAEAWLLQQHRNSSDGTKQAISKLSDEAKVNYAQRNGWRGGPKTPGAKALDDVPTSPERGGNLLTDQGRMNSAENEHQLRIKMGDPDATRIDGELRNFEQNNSEVKDWSQGKKSGSYGAKVAGEGIRKVAGAIADVAGGVVGGVAQAVSAAVDGVLEIVDQRSNGASNTESLGMSGEKVLRENGPGVVAGKVATKIVGEEGGHVGDKVRDLAGAPIENIVQDMLDAASPHIQDAVKQPEKPDSRSITDAMENAREGYTSNGDSVERRRSYRPERHDPFAMRDREVDDLAASPDPQKTVRDMTRFGERERTRREDQRREAARRQREDRERVSERLRDPVKRDGEPESYPDRKFTMRLRDHLDVDGDVVSVDIQDKTDPSRSRTITSSLRLDGSFSAPISFTLAQPVDAVITIGMVSDTDEAEHAGQSGISVEVEVVDELEGLMWVQSAPEPGDSTRVGTYTLNLSLEASMGPQPANKPQPTRP